MTFDEFQQRSLKRSSTVFPAHCQTVQFLALGIAGESGEMCNLVKKVLRGDGGSFVDKRAEILKEIADVMTYCDLLISVLGARTEDVLLSKFGEVSARYGYKG